MSAYTIERDIDIDAPAEVVWRTITEPDQIARWLADSSDVAARPGAVGTLAFGGHGEGHPLVVNLAVVTVDRPHRFSFRWTHPSGATATPANSVLVTFTLTAEGPERTSLRVQETGLEDVDMSDEDKDRYVDSHSEGWLERGNRLRDLFSTVTG